MGQCYLGRKIVYRNRFASEAVGYTYTGNSEQYDTQAWQFHTSGQLILEKPLTTKITLVGGGSSAATGTTNNRAAGGTTSLAFNATVISAAGGGYSSDIVDNVDDNGCAGTVVEQEVTLPANTAITITIGAGGTAANKGTSAGSRGAVYINLKE